MHSPDQDSSVDYSPVLAAARGERKDYALEPRPIATGGQAQVFKARHKPSGITVAFKKRTSEYNDAIARMKREIEAGHLFGGGPYVMPILDACPGFSWFVMPLASGTAETLVDDLRDPGRLRALVEALCEALRSPHEQGWVHRDIKPANVLRLEGRWVLADWGLGRRPRGQTTDPHRTRVGTSYGTEGFAAPELSTDAHAADAHSDIYSIGQLIGWALTQQWPRANVPLLPASGPWRHVVKSATQMEPGRRPASIDAFLALMQQELDPPPDIPANAGKQLLNEANQGSEEAAEALVGLAFRHVNDYELYVDVLAQLDREPTVKAVSSDVQRAIEVVQAMARHLDNATASWMPFGQVSVVMGWMLTIAQWAAQSQSWDLLEEAAEGLMEWDARWDRWGMQDKIRRWLPSLTGEAAGILASLMRRHPDAAKHFDELADDPRVDGRIRQAVKRPNA